MNDSKPKYSLAQLAAIYTVYSELDQAHTAYCCTCGKQIRISSVEDCYPLYGHFIDRSKEPALKFHPMNTQIQCAKCNMSTDPAIKRKFRQYMEFKYGENIIDKLLSEKSKYGDNILTRQEYLRRLSGLVDTFPELAEVLASSGSAHIVDRIHLENKGMATPLSTQFKMYSPIYKQELDTLTKFLRTEPIEYERL